MANDQIRPDVDDDCPEEIRELRERAAKADEYLHLARRAKADFINYQDRMPREREEWGRDALMEFVRDFLPALDSFTWARFEEPTLMESLHLVEREFLKILAQHHIVPIATAGKMFDPNLHEVVAVDETTEKPPGTILEQVRRGWTMGQRVLRPAGVRVTKAPESQKDDAEKQATKKQP